MPIICWVASETLNRQCSTSESLSNLEASFGLISRFESIAHHLITFFFFFFFSFSFSFSSHFSISSLTIYTLIYVYIHRYLNMYISLHSYHVWLTLSNCCCRLHSHFLLHLSRKCIYMYEKKIYAASIRPIFSFSLNSLLFFFSIFFFFFFLVILCFFGVAWCDRGNCEICRTKLFRVRWKRHTKRVRATGYGTRLKNLRNFTRTRGVEMNSKTYRSVFFPQLLSSSDRVNLGFFDFYIIDDRNWSTRTHRRSFGIIFWEKKKKETKKSVHFYFSCVKLLFRWWRIWKVRLIIVK